MNTGKPGADLSKYVLEVLRSDEEFVLYRGENPTQPASPSVLLLAPSSMQPTSEALSKMEYEYSLRDELDPAWAIRPLDAAPHRERTIRVFANGDGAESVLVGIRDYGVGVQDPSRLFETFFTTKEKGLGMGLAISRSIVEAHGGQLWLEPTDGSGSTFCFRLPVKQPVAAQ